VARRRKNKRPPPITREGVGSLIHYVDSVLGRNRCYILVYADLETGENLGFITNQEEVEAHRQLLEHALANVDNATKEIDVIEYDS
jgi:hypothetical protein